MKYRMNTKMGVVVVAQSRNIVQPMMTMQTAVYNIHYYSLRITDVYKILVVVLYLFYAVTLAGNN